MIDCLRDQLLRDEGEVPHAYQDSLGFLTIGVGRLIDKRKGGGLSRDEIDYLLDNDITRKGKELDTALPWLASLDPVRRGAVHNMAFQLGVGGVLKFKRTLALIQAQRWPEASAAMLQSLWAKQTPERAQRLARQITTGVWQ